MDSRRNAGSLELCTPVGEIHVGETDLKRPAATERDRARRPIDDIVHRVRREFADDAGSSDAGCRESLRQPGRGGESQIGDDAEIVQFAGNNPSVRVRLLQIDSAEIKGKGLTHCTQGKGLWTERTG